MASDLITKAKEAFIDDHFELAVDFYTQAIAIDPNNADLFSDRAQANIKLNNFTGILFINPSSFYLSFIIQILNTPFNVPDQFLGSFLIALGFWILFLFYIDLITMNSCISLLG